MKNELVTSALQAARNEIAKENLERGVAEFKKKLREREAAATVLANIDREIQELELKIQHGN